jgi:phosphoglycolate phosphatase-like HAD superfamily hydrolase
MNLAVFDIDGTLTDSVVVDEVCFLQAFRDVLGIEVINTNLLEYRFQTDSGLTWEICHRHLGRAPTPAEISCLQARFLELLQAISEPNRQPFGEVPGAGALLRHLNAHSPWHVAIATGGWRVSARFKLARAGLPVDAFPWANADDALDRVDILRTAVSRAAQDYGQHAFEKVVYVGDGVWDVRAAKALGLGFLGRAAGSKAQGLMEEGASYVLEDFSDPLQVSECLEAVARRSGEGSQRAPLARREEQDDVRCGSCA